MLLIMIYSCYSAALFQFNVTCTRVKHWKYRTGWNHFGSLYDDSLAEKLPFLPTRGQPDVVTRWQFTIMRDMTAITSINNVSTVVLGRHQSKYTSQNKGCNRDMGEHPVNTRSHDDVIKWKHFPRYWPFVQGIHRSPVNSPHKGQWRGALMFTLICARINGWVNNCEAGYLRRNRGHYDVIVMIYLSRANNKETTNDLHYWPFVGECTTGD